MRHSSLLAFVVGLSWGLLSGCETTKTLSVEEAKKLTAGISGGFVPPPRSIADITTILSDEAYAGSVFAAQRRGLADQNPPSGASDAELAKFYRGRASAAADAGRPLQRMMDLQLSWDHMRVDDTFDPKTRSQALERLAWAQLESQNFVTAFETLRLANDQRPNDAERQAALARFAAWNGDLDEARAWRARAKDSLVNWEDCCPAWERYTLAVIDHSLAGVEGRWSDGERHSRTVLAAVEKATQDHEEPRLKAWARLELAHNLRFQSRFTEAELAARDAVTYAVKRLGRIHPNTASAVTELAIVLSAQGRYEEAELLLREALDIHKDVGSVPGSWRLYTSRMAMGEVLLAQERYGPAAAIIELGVAEMRSENERGYQAWYVQFSLLPVAKLMSGDAGEALEIADKAVHRSAAQYGEKHMHAAQAIAARGMALTLLGRLGEAVADFQNALPILTSKSRDVVGETTDVRAVMLKLTLDHYLRALGGLARQGADVADEAFRVAGWARGQSVARALAANAARAAVRDPDLADLARREQDARGQIAGQFGTLTKLMNAPESERDKATILALRTRIDDLRAARATLAEEIERRFPDYSALTNPKPASIAEAQAALRPGEALVSVYSAPDQVYVWAVPKAGPVSFVARPVARNEIDDMVAELRGALDPGAETLGDIPPFDLGVAHRLYETLLKPVEAVWKPAPSLLFVPHGSLGFLPLSVLPTEPARLAPERTPLFSNYQAVPWLARRHAVTVLPSVASLVSLRGVPPGAPERAPLAAFGDPYFSTAQAVAANDKPPREIAGLGPVRGVPLRLRASPKTTEADSAGLAMLPRLPDTRDEVRSIALALRADVGSSVFLGAGANEERVKTMDLSGVKVLVFATHGLVPGDLDGLTQPALALSAPELSGTAGDGLLTMGEILELRLNADWVVLSACNTGAGDGLGAEAVSGLGRAFFYAGSRALLASNWPVHSVSAKALTTDLFRWQSDEPGLGRSESLRRAMVAMIDGGGFQDAGGRTVFAYAHPLFWAPFSLIGDGG